MGHFFKGEWETRGMKQAGPVEDFRDNSNREVTANATAKDFFVHHNIVKMDGHRIFENEVLKHGVRLWGTKEDTIRDWGRDLERELWEEAVVVACFAGKKECGMASERLKIVY